MHQKALDELEKRGKTLDAGSFNGTVQIVHQDGSVLFFNCAFAEQFEQWWLVFTEHCGYYAFYNNDLEFIRLYTPDTYIKLEEGDEDNEQVG